MAAATPPPIVSAAFGACNPSADVILMANPSRDSPRPADTDTGVAHAKGGYALSGAGQAWPDPYLIYEKPPILFITPMLLIMPTALT